jgi:hypothetical protein
MLQLKSSSHPLFLGHFLLALAGCSHALCFRGLIDKLCLTMASSAPLADADILLRFPYLWSLFVLLRTCLLGNQYVKSGQAADINLAAAYYIDFKILPACCKNCFKNS